MSGPYKFLREPLDGHRSSSTPPNTRHTNTSFLGSRTLERKKLGKAEKQSIDQFSKLRRETAEPGTQIFTGSDLEESIKLDAN